MKSIWLQALEEIDEELTNPGHQLMTMNSAILDVTIEIESLIFAIEDLTKLIEENIELFVEENIPPYGRINWKVD